MYFNWYLRTFVLKQSYNGIYENTKCIPIKGDTEQFVYCAIFDDKNNFIKFMDVPYDILQFKYDKELKDCFFHAEFSSESLNGANESDIICLTPSETDIINFLCCADREHNPLFSTILDYEYDYEHGNSKIYFINYSSKITLRLEELAKIVNNVYQAIYNTEDGEPNQLQYPYYLFLNDLFEHNIFASDDELKRWKRDFYFKDQFHFSYEMIRYLAYFYKVYDEIYDIDFVSNCVIDYKDYYFNSNTNDVYKYPYLQLLCCRAIIENLDVAKQSDVDFISNFVYNFANDEHFSENSSFINVFLKAEYFNLCNKNLIHVHDPYSIRPQTAYVEYLFKEKYDENYLYNAARMFKPTYFDANYQDLFCRNAFAKITLAERNLRAAALFIDSTTEPFLFSSKDKFRIKDHLAEPFISEIMDIISIGEKSNPRSLDYLDKSLQGEILSSDLFFSRRCYEDSLDRFQRFILLQSMNYIKERMRNLGTTYSDPLTLDALKRNFDVLWRDIYKNIPDRTVYDNKLIIDLSNYETYAQINQQQTYSFISFENDYVVIQCDRFIPVELYFDDMFLFDLVNYPKYYIKLVDMNLYNKLKSISFKGAFISKDGKLLLGSYDGGNYEAEIDKVLYKPESKNFNVDLNKKHKLYKIYNSRSDITFIYLADSFESDAEFKKFIAKQPIKFSVEDGPVYVYEDLLPFPIEMYETINKGILKRKLLLPWLPKV